MILNFLVALFQVFIFLFSSFFIQLCYAQDKVIIDNKLADLLREYKADGVIMLHSKQHNITYVNEVFRVHKKFSPASTFKITNSIIALEEKVVRDQYETIQWDGTKHEIEGWNKNQNMKSAYKESCLWFYQKLAKKNR